MAEKTIYKKLLKVQELVGKVSMDKSNKLQGYKYLSDAKLTFEINKAMVTAGIALLPPKVVSVVDYTKPTKKGSILVSRVTMEFTLIDVDSGDSETGTIIADAFDSGDKALYKAMTGARKYFFRLTFSIGSSDDVEADTPENHAVKNPPPAPAPAPDPRTAVYMVIMNYLVQFNLSGDESKNWFSKVTKGKPETVEYFNKVKNRLESMVASHKWDANILDFVEKIAPPQPPIQPVTKQPVEPVQATGKPDNALQLKQGEVIELCNTFQLAKGQRDEYFSRYKLVTIDDWERLAGLLRLKMGAGEVWNNDKKDFEGGQ